MEQTTYPIQFSVDYPDRALDRISSFFRILFAIPILIVFGSVAGGVVHWTHEGGSVSVGAGGLLSLGPLLMIVFRHKYPRWWFEWNRELLRFANRVAVYLALMDDRYPATDEHQSVHLDYAYPDVPSELNRWLPLVKWFLAIPHYLVLIVLDIALVVPVIIIAWLAVLFTGRYPRGLFGFVEGVIRWHNRVLAYAYILVTDRYPPFRLAP